MTKRTAAMTSWTLLVLGIAAFTGSALAGNGNGNGNAAAPITPATETASQGAAPGNSGNAPGQQKKASSTSSTQSTGSSAIQTSTAGVKPSNTTSTSKDTHALATSNQTKLYGNGQTAGQIAVQAGYTGMLHGPGNSQPHKAALCPSGHEVDVHALKAKGQQKKCGVTSPTTTSTQVTTSTIQTSHAAAASVTSGGAQGGAAAAPQGGVLGATAGAGKSGPAGGVLGALQAAGRGVLPFTGFPLGIALLVAVGLIALGLALRRIARQTV